MIQQQSYIRNVDNTGARFARVIRVLRKASPRARARIGDYLVITVKIATPHKKVKRGEIHKALLIRSGWNIRRKDGQYIKFRGGSCVILDKKTNLPKGKRILGPCPKEIRIQGNIKVISLSTIAL